MLYFNTASRETKALHDLCRDENASIASGLEYGQWLPVTQDPAPEFAPEGQYYDLGAVELRDGKAFQPWVLVEIQPA